MGNQASQAMAGASAKNQLNETSKNINNLLGNQPKKDGAPSNAEKNQQKKEREEAYKEKQAERAARKSKLSEQWSAHKKDNA
jgi:hypothetical protein